MQETKIVKVSLDTTKWRTLDTITSKSRFVRCVSQLTVVGEKRWDANKINNFFPDAVANAILSVSTFESVQEDKLIWNEGKEGWYSVKSGYSVTMGNNEQGGYVQVYMLVE
jgi:hypothetical protein